MPRCWFGGPSSSDTWRSAPFAGTAGLETFPFVAAAHRLLGALGGAFCALRLSFRIVPEGLVWVTGAGAQASPAWDVALGFCAPWRFSIPQTTGAYAMAALLISLAGVAWESRGEPRALRSYALALLWLAGFLPVLIIAINAIMARPLDFLFWKNSLAILAGYRWIEASSMSKAGKVHLLVSLLAGGIVFLVRGVSARHRNLGIVARPGFLLSAFLFAFVTMQSGLVRSDWGHIVVAVYVMIFFTGSVLFSFSSRAASALAVLFAVASSSLFGEPPNLIPRIRQNYSQVRDPLIECPLAHVTSIASAIRKNGPEYSRQPPATCSSAVAGGLHRGFSLPDHFWDSFAPKCGGRSNAILSRQRRATCRGSISPDWSE